MSYTDMVKRSGALQSAFTRGRPDPEARGRGDHRLRARWWLRAGAVRRLPDRGRQRHAGPARGAARHHPGRRWHPAAHPAGGPEQGQGHHLQRPVREGRRGAGDRSGRPAGPGRGCLRRGRRVGPAVLRARRRTRSERPRRASTGGSRSTSRPGSRSKDSSSLLCLRPRTGPSVCHPSSTWGPAKQSSKDGRDGWRGAGQEGGPHQHSVRRGQDPHHRVAGRVVGLRDLRVRRSRSRRCCTPSRPTTDNSLVNLFYDIADGVDLGFFDLRQPDQGLRRRTTPSTEDGAVQLRHRRDPLPDRRPDRGEADPPLSRRRSAM